MNLPHALIVTSVVETRANGSAALRVHAPGLARFPAHLRDLCALLPVTDINAALFEAIGAGHHVAPPDAAGLFLTDPFLNLPDCARRLADAGVRAAANYPTVQGLDGPSSAALAAVGHGFDQECAALAALAARSLEVVGYAASPAAALALAGLGARRIICLGEGWAPEIDAMPGVRLYRHAQAADAGQPPMP
jgi:predicted TIM-barrel enzyme